MSIRDFFDSCENSCTPAGGGAYNWSKEGMGFGQFRFYLRSEDGVLMCDNEMMSKSFIKEMLCMMVDECTLDCTSNKNNNEP